MSLDLLKRRAGFKRQGTSGVTQGMRADYLRESGLLSRLSHDVVDRLRRKAAIAVVVAQRAPQRARFKTVVCFELIDFFDDMRWYLDELIRAAFGVGQIQHPVMSKRADVRCIHRRGLGTPQHAV